MTKCRGLFIDEPQQEARYPKTRGLGDKGRFGVGREYDAASGAFTCDIVVPVAPLWNWRGRRLENESWSRYMLFMVIERFRDCDMVPVYQKLRDGGRMLPEGLKYIDSWVEPNFSRCFQLMECDDARLLQEWILQWRGFGTRFEIIPVVGSKETREVVTPHLERA